MSIVIPISDPSNPFATTLGVGDILVMDQVDGSTITGYRTKRITTKTLFANVPDRVLIGNSPLTGWWSTYTAFQPMVWIQDSYGTSSLGLATRTSDWSTNYPPTGGTNLLDVINYCSITVHDRTTTGPASIWCAYEQAEKTATATDIGFIMREMSFHNLSSTNGVSDPYTPNTSNQNNYTCILRLDNGLGAGTSNPVTTGLSFINNSPSGGLLNTAIEIAVNCLATVSGLKRALTLGATHSIVWYSAASTVAGSMNVDGSNIMQLGSLAGIKINSSTGALLTVGNGTVSASTNPSAIVMDNTLSSVAGANPKITLFNNGAQYGIGVSSGSLDYMVPTSAVHGFYVNGTLIKSVSSTALNLSSGIVLSVAGTQVVGTRKTGWTVATGTPSRATFTTSGVALATLAGVVMALEQDLISHGLIGT